MNYYITKYALTMGILCEECVIDIVGYVHILKYKPLPSSYFELGVDAFEKYEEAHLKALSMKNKKIASLKKQLFRLEKLRFEMPKEETENGNCKNND
jgi:biotin synthase-related radical SAM superfamily protein